MRKWVVIAGLVCALAMAGACASGQFGAITLTHSLQMHEDHHLIGEWKDFDTEITKPYFKPLVDAVRKRGHEIIAAENIGWLLANAGYLDILQAGGVWGFNDGNGKIYLEASLSWDEAFATLVHELGHSLQPDELDGTDDAQVYAEALSYVVCYRLGLDTKGMSFPYLQDFKNRHRIIQQYSRELDAQATELLAEIRK
jgi:hypothetical protein